MKQLLCYGDSNTWGLIPGTQERYPRGTRWTNILQDRLMPQYIRIAEEGLCGRTTVFEDAYRQNRNGLKTLPLILETYAPIDAAVIMLGTNDCKAYFKLNAWQIRKGMEQCVDMLLTVLPPEKILLISLIHLGPQVWKPEFDPEFDWKSVETSLQLSDEYRKLAAEKRIRMLAASDYAGPSEIDQEHMTKEGTCGIGNGCLPQVICFSHNSVNCCPGV